MATSHPGNTSTHYSSTTTGAKVADPYTAANLDDVNVPLKEKVEDMMKFVEAVKFGMMTTRQDRSGLLVSRCMTLAARESGVDLIFYTNTEQHKTDELRSDPHVNVTFVKPSSGEWASISGVAAIETQREKIKQYYSPTLKAWVGDLEDAVHDGGPEDPRIAIIKVKAVTATHALAKGSMVSRGFEVAKGALTGSAAQTTKLREITEGELEQYRTIN